MAELVIPCSILLVSGILIYKSVAVIGRMNGTSIRATEKERRDYFDLIQKLVEKQTCTDSQSLADLHAQERVTRLRVDSSTEQKSFGTAPSQTQFDGEYSTPEEAQM